MNWFKRYVRNNTDPDGGSLPLFAIIIVLTMVPPIIAGIFGLSGVVVGLGMSALGVVVWTTIIMAVVQHAREERMQ